jgi:O-antigen/teichoic acid export membrane protein
MISRFSRRYLLKDGFGAAVITLASGVLASQVLILMASPILTRFYRPADFGLLGVFAALLGLGGVVSSLRYQLAIPLPQSDREGANLLVLSLTIVTITSSILGVVLLSLQRPFANLLGVVHVRPYLWVMVGGLASVGTYQAFSYWAIRKRQFSAVSRTKVTQSLTMIAVQLSGSRFGPIALVLGHTLGQAAGTLSLGLKALRDPDCQVTRTPRIRDTAWRYRDFPRYSSMETLLNAASNQVPPILIAGLFGPPAAGFYFLAQRVLQTPITLVGRAISDALLSEAPRTTYQGALANRVRQIHSSLVAFSMPPMVLLAIAGPQLFASIFGESWRTAGVLAQLMSPWLFMVSVTSPLMILFSALEEQRTGMKFQAYLFGVRFLAVVLGSMTGNLSWTVGLFSIGSTAVWVAILRWIILATGNPPHLLWRPSVKALLVSGPPAIPILLATLGVIPERLLAPSIGLWGVLTALNWIRSRNRSF